MDNIVVPEWKWVFPELAQHVPNVGHRCPWIALALKGALSQLCDFPPYPPPPPPAHWWGGGFVTCRCWSSLHMQQLARHELKQQVILQIWQLEELVSSRFGHPFALWETRQRTGRLHAKPWLQIRSSVSKWIHFRGASYLWSRLLDAASVRFLNTYFF